MKSSKSSVGYFREDGDAGLSAVGRSDSAALRDKGRVVTTWAGFRGRAGCQDKKMKGFFKEGRGNWEAKGTREGGSGRVGLKLSGTGSWTCLPAPVWMLRSQNIFFFWDRCPNQSGTHCIVGDTLPTFLLLPSERWDYRQASPQPWDTLSGSNPGLHVRYTSTLVSHIPSPEPLGFLTCSFLQLLSSPPMGPSLMAIPSSFFCLPAVTQLLSKCPTDLPSPLHSFSFLDLLLSPLIVFHHLESEAHNHTHMGEGGLLYQKGWRTVFAKGNCAVSCLGHHIPGH